MKIPTASIVLSLVSALIFFIGFVTLFEARGRLMQVVVAMLAFVIVTQLLVGAVLSYELWRLNQRLTRQRSSYGPSVGEDRAA